MKDALQEKEKIEIETEAKALMQMYQAGFLDGFNYNSYRKRTFEFVKSRAFKSFNMRFGNQLQGKIKSERSPEEIKLKNEILKDYDKSGKVNKKLMSKLNKMRKQEK